MQQNQPMGLTDWALLLTLSVLWGGSFFFSKVALSELPPLSVVLARVSIAALALFVYLRIRRQPIPADAATWAAFLGMGLLNNLIPFTLLFWGQTQIASGLASILNATTPIFSILVAHLLTSDEGITRNKLVGIVLGFTGVAVLMAGNAMKAEAIPLLPILACLAAALSYGFASVFGRRFRRMGISPATSAFGQVSATTLMMIPMVALVDTPWHLPMPGMNTIAALLGLGLLSTALAYIIFFHILAVGGAINSSLVTLLIPVSAILLGYLFLGERLASNHFAGMGLIALGLLSIDGRLFRWLLGQRRKSDTAANP
jgi:drug/metabolite transporter (DMT)-like permease